MKRQWIKLYLEILHDPKMGRMSDHLWRRVIEMFLLAGEFDQDGLLPPVEDMAWRLRTSAELLIEDLQALQGIVEINSNGWFVKKFKERQWSESYERVKRYRNGYSNGKSNGVVTENSSPLLSSTSYSQEGGGVGEGSVTVTPSLGIPETPRQAMANPYIQAYQKITGGFPGDHDYGVIIDTFQHFEKQHGGGYVDYLTPYWTAWSTRTTKEGKPYKKNSRVWYCEWAMQGEIPKANGHEPQVTKSWTPVPDAEATRKMLEEREREWKQAKRPSSVGEIAKGMAK